MNEVARIVASLPELGYMTTFFYINNPSLSFLRLVSQIRDHEFLGDFIDPEKLVSENDFAGKEASGHCSEISL